MLRVPGEELHGFEPFMGWYADRRARVPDFRYEAVDILGGERRAAVVIDLSDGTKTWRQVALCEVREGRIASIALYEDEV